MFENLKKYKDKAKSFLKKAALVVVASGIIAGTAHAKILKPKIEDAKIINRDKIRLVVKQDNCLSGYSEFLQGNGYSAKMKTILDNNPQFKADPDNIKPGDIVELPIAQLSVDAKQVLKIADSYSQRIDSIPMKQSNPYIVSKEDTQETLKFTPLFDFSKAEIPKTTPLFGFAKAEVSKITLLFGSSQKLESPIENPIITAKQSRNRYHPVYHYRRPHYGTDSVSRTGNDNIKFTGEKAIISNIGFDKNGYGRDLDIDMGYMKIRYAHLQLHSTDHLKKGQIIREGDVIAKIGKTGNATKKHLDLTVIIKDFEKCQERYGLTREDVMLNSKGEMIANSERIFNYGSSSQERVVVKAKPEPQETPILVADIYDSPVGTNVQELRHRKYEGVVKSLISDKNKIDELVGISDKSIFDSRLEKMISRVYDIHFPNEDLFSRRRGVDIIKGDMMNDSYLAQALDKRNKGLVSVQSKILNSSALDDIISKYKIQASDDYEGLINVLETKISRIYDTIQKYPIKEKLEAKQRWVRDTIDKIFEAKVQASDDYELAKNKAA